MFEVLLKSLCHIKNPKWPPVVILNYAKSFSETESESSFAPVQYHWIMQTVYYTTMHLEALQAALLLETNVYLFFFGGHLGFGIKMTTKHNSNTRNGFVTLELVGLEVLL